MFGFTASAAASPTIERCAEKDIAPFGYIGGSRIEEDFRTDGTKQVIEHELLGHKWCRWRRGESEQAEEGDSATSATAASSGD